jgi:hypothetical protein
MLNTNQLYTNIPIMVNIVLERNKKGHLNDIFSSGEFSDV